MKKFLFTVILIIVGVCSMQAQKPKVKTTNNGTTVVTKRGQVVELRWENRRLEIWGNFLNMYKVTNGREYSEKYIPKKTNSEYVFSETWVRNYLLPGKVSKQTVRVRILPDGVGIFLYDGNRQIESWNVK